MFAMSNLFIVLEKENARNANKYLCYLDTTLEMLQPPQFLSIDPEVSPSQKLLNL